MSWFNLQVKKDDHTVFRASAKSWRGLIQKLAEKHWGGFEEMVAHIFREDWVYRMTGEKVGDLKAEDLEEISEKTQNMANKLRENKK